MGGWWDVFTCLVEKIKRVSVGGFKIGTMFGWEVDGKNIQVLRLADGCAIYFDAEATGVRPITHGHIGGKVVGDEHCNAAGVCTGKGAFFADNQIVMVALVLDFLFSGGVSLSLITSRP